MFIKKYETIVSNSVSSYLWKKKSAKIVNRKVLTILEHLFPCPMILLLIYDTISDIKGRYRTTIRNGNVKFICNVGTLF